ncbi:hypothetical protein LTR85_002056 [Meristemomyces frigidus]|nr:hypothetical protein LTR85_002056 [Meristemomyces frigidus]
MAEKKAVQQEERREAENDRRQRLLDDTPITELMIGPFRSSSLQANDEVMIGNILNTMRAWCSVGGRQRVRIDFTPSATEARSIASRLRAALMKGEWAAEVEKLLCLFVAWNKTAFLEVEAEQMAVNVKPGDYMEKSYRSEWLFHQKTYEAIKPVKWSKRKATVAAVVHAVRTRCERAYPESLLLRGVASTSAESNVANVAEWSLVKDTEGFGVKVLASFTDPQLTSKEYEDQIERCLYNFKVANKTEVYGVVWGGADV